jgi:mannose-1-phosphate guanylyltransferase
MSASHRLQAVVIAGGSGTRFWPLSRQARPKQLINLSGEATMLQSTFNRVEALCGPAQSWMVVGAHHAQGCRDAAPAVPGAQCLVEPLAKNTAPAIGLAAIHLMHWDPASVMAVLPADHHVADRDAFCAALGEAQTLAEQGSIVTLGIAPTHPETGYGYIEQGEVDGRSDKAFTIATFREKPDRATAEAFLRQGGFLWNAGIFVMQPAVYLQEVARQLPALHDGLMRIAATIGKPDYQVTLERIYHQLAGVSIDYGVMEGAQNTCVVPVDCGWSDVGSWSALGAVVDAGDNGNIVSGRAVLIDSKDCIVFAEPGHMVGAVGVSDLVVVHTADATLVIPKHRAQEVRDILAAIGANAWPEYT